MRLPCPFCGTRDLREFYCQGTALPRPASDADQAAWADYVHLRDNLPGEVQEFWHHTQGCGAWLVVTRNTVSHEILDAKLAVDRKETAP